MYRCFHVYDAGEEPPLHAPVAGLPLGRHRASRAAVMASPTEVEVLRYVEDDYLLSSVIISDDDVVATAEPAPGTTYISNWFGRASLEPPTATLSLLRDQVSQAYWMPGALVWFRELFSNCQQFVIKKPSTVPLHNITVSSISTRLPCTALPKWIGAVSLRTTIRELLLAGLGLGLGRS